IKQDGTKIKNADFGLVPTSKFLKNVTCFGKNAGGGFKKITIYNVGADNGLTLAMKDKAEGVVAVELSAHWKSSVEVAEQNIWEIDDVTSITTISDATLSALTIGILPINPTFDSEITEYDVETTNATNTVTVAPTDDTAVI